MDISVMRLHNRRMMVATVPDYRLYRETPQEAADFWIHCEPIPARTRLHRWEIAAHRHPALFQLFHVTQGSGEILGGAASRAFVAPCVLFIPPAAVHGFRFTRDVDGSVLSALADRLGHVTASERLVAAFGEDIRIVPTDGSGIPALFDRLAWEVSDRAPGRAAALEALVALLIVDLARLWQPSARTMTDDAGQDLRFDRLAAAVDVHFREGRPLSYYAGLVGLSPSQANRLARRSCGLTVQGMIARRLIEAARRELVFTPTPVAVIAETLGFADPAYFNRFFRRQTGKTPGAFRARERLRMAESVGG